MLRTTSPWVSAHKAPGKGIWIRRPSALRGRGPLDAEHERRLLKKLGKGCRYSKNLVGVDRKVLQELVNEAYN